MAVVLDTDIVSYLYKRDTRAQLYRKHLNDPPFIISFMTLAELRRWTFERNWGEQRRQELEEYLSRYFVVDSEDQICSRWAEAMNSARSNGRPIAASDAWIAATALFLDVPLVTHKTTKADRLTKQLFERSDRWRACFFQGQIYQTSRT